MQRNLSQLLFTRGVPPLLFALLLMFCGGTLGAQSRVTGTVQSAEGESLIGATVLVEGVATSGTITDLDGNFALTVPNGDAVLVFSYTGYESQRVPVNNQTVINVTLEADAETLDEVVVVGYGYVDKKDLTGSVSSVKGEDLTRVQSINFEKGLAAQAAGVQVVTTQGGPGAAAQIRVRGGTSINATNDPLYVIDGFPLVGSAQSQAAGPGRSSESPLSSINPEDIESIEVLKDASATAIYGSRGANGVIIITTKQGKEGRAQLTYSNSFGVGAINRFVDVLTPQEYVDYWNEYHTFGIVTFENRDRAFRDDFGNDIDLANDDQIRVIDWRDRVFRNSFNMRHNLNVNGGSQRTRYNASFGYATDEGVVDGSYYDRYSANLNVTQELANNLHAGINLNAGFVDRGGAITAAGESGSARQSSVLTMLNLFPNVQGRVRFSDARYDADGILIEVRDGEVLNPQRQIARTHNFGNVVNGFGNVYLQYNLSDDLFIKSTFGGNYYNNNSEGVFPSDLGWSRQLGGIAYTSLWRSYGWLNENTVSYNKQLSDNHRISAVAGYTQQGSTNRSLGTSSQDFALPGVDVDNLNSATITNPTRSFKSQWGLQSFLGRINYTLNEKYLFTVSARADGSSRFADGNKWGFFPSGAVSWRVSQEPFLQNSNTISNLKLRASYGVTGNNGIGEYRSLSQYDPSRVIIGGSIVSGARVGQLGNENLTWETTTQSDLGFELGLFNNRVNVEFDYYVKDTRDLLLNRPLPPETGFTSALQNFGRVENRGVELSINTTPIDKKNFRWNFRFNVAQNRNEVLDIGDAEFLLFNSPGFNQGDFIVRVGDPIGSFYGYQTDGVYNYEDFPAFDGMSAEQASQTIRDMGGQWWDHFFELRDGTPTRAGVSQYRPGMLRLRDIAGRDDEGNRVLGPDGTIDEADRTIIGTAQPDFFGGFTNDFSIGNFSLNFLFQFSVGNEVYNNNRTRGYATAIPNFNKLGEVRDRWTLDDPNSDFPSIWGFGDAGVNNEALDVYIEDGSFLRLSNVTLGYTLPRGFLTTTNARVFAAIDNAFLITDYSGYDPEVSVGGQLTPGVDFDSYPRQRVFRGGLSVTF